MALRDDELILGTGNDGKIFSVTTAGDRSVLLADMEARRIPALLVRPDGAILLATGNAGAVCLLSRTPAPKGTFTAKPVDAGQVARWGAAQIDADVPAGAALTISTRTGNVQTPDEKTWSAWTGPLPLTGRFHKIASPAGRFMQYRLAFAPQPKGASPLVRSVSMVSQVGNLPPWIAAASVSPSATPDESDRDAVKAAGRKVFRVVRVQAVDPNGDVLQFRFEYRPAGAEGWIELAKDVAAPLYAWNTLMVADGAYELRITVSDKASNPPDQALQVTHVGLRTLVDHTPPVIATLAARLEGQTVTVSGAVHDAISRITSIYYSLDSQDPWVPVLPTDGICDDQAEDFRFTLKAVTPGTHQITVRVRDSCGNVAYQTLPVAVQK
jgi:hypothetical protein